MTKTMTRHGNSLALVIDKPVLELLNIAPDTPLEITSDGKRLIIEPRRDVERRERFEAAYDVMSKRYHKTLARLAK